MTKNCAWCFGQLMSTKIQGRRGFSLMFVDGMHTTVVAKDIEILDFCSTNCREQYYFGM